MAHSSIKQQLTEQQIEVAIVGAGLAGLYLAHLLVSQKGALWGQHNLRIYEANERAGGRVLGTPASGFQDNFLDPSIAIFQQLILP